MINDHVFVLNQENESILSFQTSSQIQTADSQIVDDSDDEIIALSDDDENSSQQTKKVIWTSSEIQITTTNSQSQSMHNPYRVGIADPSIRSIFLPPPNSQSMSSSQTSNKRAPKRTTGSK